MAAPDSLNLVFGEVYRALGLHEFNQRQLIAGVAVSSTARLRFDASQSLHSSQTSFTRPKFSNCQIVAPPVSFDSQLYYRPAQNYPGPFGGPESS